MMMMVMMVMVMMVMVMAMAMVMRRIPHVLGSIILTTPPVQ